MEAPDVFTQLGMQAHHGDHVTALIEAATESVEAYIGRALITRTMQMTLDAFPCAIELPYTSAVGPLAGVEIRYLDDAGDQQTLAAEAYRISTARSPAAIEPAYGESWPSVRCVSEAIEIDYPAGYGEEPTSIPRPILQAIVFTVGEWFEFREGVVMASPNAIPHGARHLLNQYRLGRLFAGQGM